MRPIRLPVLAIITSAALLSQPAAFGIEHQNPETTKLPISADTSNASQLYFASDGKDEPLGIDGKKRDSLEPGQSLPILDIQAGGEISVNDKTVVKKPWSSKSLENKGKVQLVQYVAANRGAARQNKPFNDTLKEKRFTSEQLSITVIVQTSDNMAFTKGIVVGKLAKNKAKYETISFVVDDNGLGLQRWGIKHKSSAIIVLDANGKVLFAKDGPLSEVEVESTIKLIETQMS